MTESTDKRNPPAKKPDEQGGKLPMPDEERASEVPIEDGDFDAQTR
jgi:hypothetical protein